MPHSRGSSAEAPDLRHDPSRTVLAPIGFLEPDPGFEHEEPYAFRYQADVPVPLTNMKTQFKEVSLCDLRGQEDVPSLDHNGFEILKLRSEMKYEQFESPASIEQVYVRDLKKQLCVDKGANEVDILRVRTRKRHPQFPKSIGTGFVHHQPSTAAHIDTTTASASDKVKEKRGQAAEAYLQRPYQILNVWKPLRGPLKDWPLGVCDVRTVDSEKDIVEATILHETYVNHNCQVQFNPEQQWYYLRNQEPDELMVFRQFDSRIKGNNGVPHSSFEDPTTPPTAIPRESIEVMAILYFD